MKVQLCDICKNRIISNQYKVRIKKRPWNFYENRFEKMDICQDCADRIIFNLKKCNKESE